MSGIQIVFISSLAPGTCGGGPLVTLAYLQACLDVSDGAVDYIGPEGVFGYDLSSIGLRSVTITEGSGSRSVIGRLIFEKAFTRLAAVVAAARRRGALNEVIAVVNGDAGGESALLCKSFGLKTVMIFHNFLPEYNHAERAGRSWWKTPANLLLESFAQKAYEMCDARVLLTREDAASYERASKATALARVTIADSFFCAKIAECVSVPSYRLPGSFVISCNLALSHNVLPILSFLRDVWAERLLGVNASLVIAGRNPPDLLVNGVSEIPNVRLLGRPTERQMTAVYDNASAAICLNDGGSGIKVRVGEALRRGLPVISSVHCARGFAVMRGRGLFVFEGRGELERFVRQFSTSHFEMRPEDISSAYEDQFSFSNGSQRFRAMLQRIGATERVEDCENLRRLK